MLLSKLKLPLILGAVLMLALVAFKFIDAGKQLGTAAVKVDVMQSQLVVVEQVEVKRNLQMAADNKNVIDKQAKENEIRNEFNAYHEKVTGHANEPANVSVKKKPSANNPGLVPGCELSPANFGVLLTAFDATFKRNGVSAHTRTQPALATRNGKAPNQWQQRGLIDTELRVNGAYKNNRNPLSEPGVYGERAPDVTCT